MLINWARSSTFIHEIAHEATFYNEFYNDLFGFDDSRKSRKNRFFLFDAPRRDNNEVALNKCSHRERER